MELSEIMPAMPSTLPPFPNNVPTAPLIRISLQKLLSNDVGESERFFTACEELGFFYLDLQNTHEGTSILNDADALFDLGEQFFDLDLEEKRSYDFSGQNSYVGYKGYGTAVIDKAGALDRNEFYNVCPTSRSPPLPSTFSSTHSTQLLPQLTPALLQVSKDDILSLSAPLPAPSLISRNHQTLKSYIQTSHTLTSLLLTHLNTHLHLPPSTILNLHRLSHASGDHVRFVKAPPQPNR